MSEPSMRPEYGPMDRYLHGQIPPYRLPYLCKGLGAFTVAPGWAASHRSGIIARRTPPPHEIHSSSAIMPDSVSRTESVLNGPPCLAGSVELFSHGMREDWIICSPSMES